MKLVNDASLPVPAGHYSPAVVHNGLVFVSGQLARVPGKPGYTPPTIEEQTHQCLLNAEAILLAAGSRRDQVLKATIFVSSTDYWAGVNAEYAKFFGAHKPARAIIPAGNFRDGYLLEIELIAAVAT
jgi:2-iminobutanoate/2-iminopropanoate deaminase